jgi:hypothetical protein
MKQKLLLVLFADEKSLKPEERGIPIQRQRWDDYVAKLRTLLSREQILKDYGTIVPYPQKVELAPKSPSAGYAQEMLKQL